MASATIPGVYAAALIELARERGTLDAVIQSCHALADALTPDVVRPLLDPRIDRATAKRSLEAVVASHPKDIRDFLQVLLERNRLESASAIFRETIVQHEQHEGIVHVHLTLASEPAPTFRDELIAGIRAKNGAKAVLNLTIDANLIAGYTSRTGNSFVDASTRRALNEMRLAMRSTPLTDSLWGA